jgi:peptidoglycan/LPS O-acetylase OafA/YrhL
LKYRSDIDGLRTIAVVLVILNHIGIGFFSGGFVGVDVFFVISGFLITAIIYPLIAVKKFSFKWFISRRIKRLMPVLFFVLFVSLVFFSSFMLPQDLVQFYQSILWIIFYGGNFFFWREYGGYFDGGSSEVPLLHTWSLAIEEQYYFIWPIILIIAFKFLHKKHMLIFSFILCLITIYLSELGTELTIGAAYYLLPTRFFELLVGSCLAIAWTNLPTMNRVAQHCISLTGLFLILYSAIFLNEHSSFPGYNALYPVIGTAMLIYTSQGVVNKFLATKPFVFTGNISYSLYLWHWPIIVYFNYKSITLSANIQVFIVILTYLLAVLSWKYIEQPIRHSKSNSFGKVIKQFYFIPTIIFMALITIGIYKDGFKDRFDVSTLKMEAAVNSHANKLRGSCHSSFRQVDAEPSSDCEFGKTENYSSTAFLFGDSHANHLVPFIDELAKSADSHVQDYTLDQCLPVAGLEWGGNSYKAKQCKQRNDKAIKHIKEHKFDFVILGASWPSVATRRVFIEGIRAKSTEVEQEFVNRFTSSIAAIVSTGAIPIVINNTPTLGGKSPKCPIKKSLFDDNLNCSIEKAQNKFIDKVLNGLSVKYPQLVSINLNDLMCNDEGCSMSLNNIPLYRDDDHLNVMGARELSSQYLLTYKNPFL